MAMGRFHLRVKISVVVCDYFQFVALLEGCNVFTVSDIRNVAVGRHDHVWENRAVVRLVEVASSVAINSF